MTQHNTIDHSGLTGVISSYASNANAVASVSAGGAATTVPRGDHVHDGVTSVSHTSNTFDGPVTLTAQGSIGITSPSAGTFAINAVAGAGGAGSPATAAFAGCKAYHDTTQSITDNTSTAVALNQEDSDSDAFHDLVTNNSRFTVPAGKGGKYLLVGQVTFATNGTGIRQAWWSLNGTIIRGAVVTYMPNASNQVSFSSVVEVALAVGDYVQLFCYQNSGGALNIGHTTSPGLMSVGVVALIGT